MGANPSKLKGAHRRVVQKKSSSQTGTKTSTDGSSSEQPEAEIQSPERLSFSTTGSIKDKYVLKQMLGKGNFSTVRLAVTKKKNRQGVPTKVAVKCIIKKKLSPKDFESLKQEAAILRMLDHPNIIKLYDLFEDEELYYIVTEYAPGGELFERVVKKEYYVEEDAQIIILKIAKALQFCHDAGVVHRDLKPENILLASSSDDAEIKLCDFGFAKTVDPDDPAALATACGTPGYVAPEVISGHKYGMQVDVWSLGVIVYILLCGYPPFRAETRTDLFRLIKHANFEFDSPWWDDVSDSAKDLVVRMLTVDPLKRITIPQILEHPWLKEASDRDITPALSALERFNAQRKVVAAQMLVLAAKTMSRLAADRRQARLQESAARKLKKVLNKDSRGSEETDNSTATNETPPPAIGTGSSMVPLDAKPTGSTRSTSRQSMKNSKSKLGKSRPSLASINSVQAAEKPLNSKEVLQKLDSLYEELERRRKKISKKMKSEEVKLNKIVDKLVSDAPEESLKEEALVLLKRKRVYQRQLDTIESIQSELEEHTIAIESGMNRIAEETTEDDNQNTVSSHLLLNSSTTNILTPTTNPTESTFSSISTLIDDAITESTRDMRGKRTMGESKMGLSLISEALDGVGNQLNDGVMLGRQNTTGVSASGTLESDDDEADDEEASLACELEELQVMLQSQQNIHGEQQRIDDKSEAPANMLNFQLKALEVPTIGNPDGTGVESQSAGSLHPATIWGTSEDEKVASTLRQLHIDPEDSVTEKSPHVPRVVSTPNPNARQPGVNRSQSDFSMVDVTLAAMATAATSGGKSGGSNPAASAAAAWKKSALALPQDSKSSATSDSKPVPNKEPTDTIDFPKEPLPPNADVLWGKSLAYFTAFAPERVCPGQQFSVNVWAHCKFGEDGKAKVHTGPIGGPLRIRIGARVFVELEVDTATFEFIQEDGIAYTGTTACCRERLYWKGESVKCGYQLSCKMGTQAGSYHARAVIYIAGVAQGALNCPLIVEKDAIDASGARKKSVMAHVMGRRGSSTPPAGTRLSASLVPLFELQSNFTIFPSKFRPHVYLSYAPAHFSVALRVSNTLSSFGYTCFMQPAKFNATAPVPSKYKVKLGRAAVVVPILGPAPCGRGKVLSKLSTIGAIAHYSKKSQEVAWHTEFRVAMKDPFKLIMPLSYRVDFNEECDKLPADLQELEFSKLNSRVLRDDMFEPSVVALHRGIQSILVSREKSSTN